MGNFKQLRGSCPICNTKYKNRSCSETYTGNGRRKVHCWGGERDVTGWGYVGEDSLGKSIFIEGWQENYTPDPSTAFQRELERRRRQEREQWRISNRTSGQQRHDAYQSWLPQQRLTEAQKDALRVRGLTDYDISRAENQGWLRNWIPGVTVPDPGAGTKDLPGYKHGVITGIEGMAIAAPNIKREIAGFQIAPANKDLPKYIWLKGCTLPSGEQPMPIFQHPDRPRDQPVILWITEGFLKPLITALNAWRDGHLNIVVIGAGGSNWASCRQQLLNAIAKIKPQTIELLPDAGATANIHVAKQIHNLAELVPGLKYRWWGQNTKGIHHDPDEISTQEILDSDLWTFPTTTAIQSWKYDAHRMKSYRPGYAFPLEYQSHEREKIWAKYARSGLIILDTSPPGTGKTHAAGDFAAKVGGNGVQVVVAANNHRNPDTDTVELLPDMPSKHSGLVYESTKLTALGNYHQRLPKKGEKPDTDPSCYFADAYHAAATSGVHLHHGKNSPLCQRCPWAEITNDGEGGVQHLTCSFIKHSQEVKSQPAYRAHPSSIKAADDGIDQIVLIDEAKANIQTTQTRTTGLDAITREKIEINVKNDKLGKLVEPVIAALQAALLDLQVSEKSEDFYGWTHNQLMSKLPSMDILASKINDVFGTAIEVIDGNPVRLMKWLARKLNRILGHSIAKAIESSQSVQDIQWGIENLTQSKWLPNLIKSIAGIQGYVATAEQSGLKLHTEAPQHRNAIKRAKGAILLDGTWNPKDARLAIKSPVFWIKQKTPRYSGLTINLVRGMGTVGTNRRPDGTYTVSDRLKAATTAIAEQHDLVAVVDYKRFHDCYSHLENAITPFTRFAEGRGSNRAMGCDALIVAGRPSMNLGAAAAIYGVQSGCSSPSDSDDTRKFFAWYNRQSDAELKQEFDRLRAHRDGDRTIWMIGDLSRNSIAYLKAQYPGATFNEIDIMEIAPMAANKGRRTAHNLISLLQQQISDFYAGKRSRLPKLKEIADELGLTPTACSDSLRKHLGVSFRPLQKSLILLLEGLNNKSFDFSNPELVHVVSGLKQLGIAIKNKSISEDGVIREYRILCDRYGKKLVIETQESIRAVATELEQIACDMAAAPTPDDTAADRIESVAARYPKPIFLAGLQFLDVKSPELAHILPLAYRVDVALPNFDAISPVPISV